MKPIRELDETEIKIIRELVRNPRISDNQLAKRTKIPVMTVNRKRKRLEQEGLIWYYTSINTSEFGLGIFNARQIYIIKFKLGITREQYFKSIEHDKKLMPFHASYVALSYLGEKDGHLALIMRLDAETESKLVDEFNNKIIPHLREKLGQDCVREVISVRISDTIRRHHNYLPFFNMENGILKKDWPDEWIFAGKAP